MKQKHYMGIRLKIVLCTILCVVGVGLGGNLYLYQYMQSIIEEKAANIDSLYAETIAAQIDYRLEQVTTLSYYCANSPEVAAALRRASLSSTYARSEAIAAQNAMNSYLRTSPIDGYINKLFIFNEQDVIVHAVTAYYGSTFDITRLMESDQFHRWDSDEWQPFDRVYRSLNPEGPDCFVLWVPVYEMSSYPVGYVYIEVDAELVNDVLAANDQLNRYFVQTVDGSRLIPASSAPLLSALPARAESGATFSYGGELYAIETYPLNSPGFTLSSCINQTVLMADNQDVLFSLVTVLLMITSISVVVIILLTRYITIPIGRIMEKINKISLNDYSYDPELELPHNEMGEVGARLNELGLGIKTLLDETIALHDERSEIEMALLQSQVNPHFLYNTLNSVHYMAVMQKNPGIEKLVRSLVNLLKNVSKGVSDKIPLSGELSLLDDYIAIQSIRYIGTFDYICNVPEELQNYRLIKFTLQPLVENAIFHGVVPKGEFGTITVDAHEEDGCLVVTVTDDGVGMTVEEAKALLRLEGRADKSSMSGIGVANVNRRLKLAYGREYGLSVESVKGSYTRLSVRIPMEL